MNIRVVEGVKLFDASKTFNVKSVRMSRNEELNERVVLRSVKWRVESQSLSSNL